MVDRLLVIKVNKTIIKLVFEVLSATQKLTERTRVPRKYIMLILSQLVNSEFESVDISVKFPKSSV